MKFTREQHDKTGLELHICPNQVKEITSIFHNTYLITNRIYGITGNLVAYGQNPTSQLRCQMDDYACQELPTGTRALKLYYRGKEPDHQQHEILSGSPEVLARAFKQAQDAKVLQMYGRSKTKLSLVEIIFLVVWLQHISNRIALTGIKTAKAITLAQRQAIRPGAQERPCKTSLQHCWKRQVPCCLPTIWRKHHEPDKQDTSPSEKFTVLDNPHQRERQDHSRHCLP